MTEGGGRDVKHQLQGIEEKLCRSMDSISTLGSDTTLETKLFEEMEASKQKSSGSSKLTNSSNKGSSGEGDSKAKVSPKGTKAAMTQASKVTGPRRSVPISLSPLGSSTPVKTEATRSSPLGGSTSGTSPGDNVKSSARRSTSSKTGKATADSTSKTPPGIRAKNKVSNLLSSNLSSRTSPTTSSGSSSSTSDVNRRSSRGSDAHRRSLVNSEKSSATNARRKDEQRIGKTPSSIGFQNKSPPVNSHPSSTLGKTPSIIGFKNKPPPVNSHPSSPLRLSNSSPSKSPVGSISQRPSESSSSTSTVDQSSISKGGSRGTSVQHRSLNRDASAKSTLKNHPAPDRRGKQPAASRPQTGSISRSPVQPAGRGIPSSKNGFIDKGRSYKSCLLTGLPENGGTQSKSGSSNGAKATKVPPPRTVDTGLKPNSQKTTSTKQKQQSSGKAKPNSSSASIQTLVLTSPEVLDIKGKLNALRMEISNQKKGESKDIKMAPGGSGKGNNNKPSSNINSSYQANSTSMRENDQIPKKVTSYYYYY